MHYSYLKKINLKSFLNLKIVIMTPKNKVLEKEIVNLLRKFVGAKYRYMV